MLSCILGGIIIISATGQGEQVEVTMGKADVELTADGAEKLIQQRQQQVALAEVEARPCKGCGKPLDANYSISQSSYRWRLKFSTVDVF